VSDEFAALGKPVGAQRQQFEGVVDFVGFPVDNAFVVGYGTDYAEKYRHLPYISIGD
jgi:hypoxanthine phosphoribosyltransferase